MLAGLLTIAVAGPAALALDRHQSSDAPPTPGAVKPVAEPVAVTPGHALKPSAPKPSAPGASAAAGAAAAAPGTGAPGAGTPAPGTPEWADQAPTTVMAPPVVDNDGPLPGGWTRTRFGPLSPADRDFVVRVRLAGLWEAQAGRYAQERSTNTVVREVGARLARDHARLDAQVRSVADQLSVDLPNRPSDEQQSWLDEMTSKRGSGFDTIFTDRLRAAHGKVFTLLSAIRAGTRNTLVRTMAQIAVDVVMSHMTLLESTDLVDYADLPAPPDPPASTSSTEFLRHGQVLVIWILILSVAAAAAWTVWRAVRAR